MRYAMRNNRRNQSRIVNLNTRYTVSHDELSPFGIRYRQIRKHGKKLFGASQESICFQWCKPKTVSVFGAG